jgi:hypothetical protein
MNVKELHFIRLNLVQPLRYTRDDRLNPFDGSIAALPEGGWEAAFNLILDSERGQEFEPPSGGRYFAALLNAGKARLSESLGVAGTALADSAWADGRDDGETVELPAGLYLFTQAREFLDEAEVTVMALELQQEGLWQRLEMENRVYLRYLYEDGSAVTQLFRPIAGETAD